MTGAESPRVLGIAGSPRRHGNSARLLDAALDAAERAGATIDRLVLADEPIAACRGCQECSTTGSCVVSDHMSDVYPRLDRADAIVVASPVYFATVPSGLKALYDRCQPYWVRRYLLREPLARRRPGALLLVGGGGDPFGHECAMTTTRSVFAVLGVDPIAETFAKADVGPGAEVGESDLEAAAAVGEDLARRALEGD